MIQIQTDSKSEPKQMQPIPLPPVVIFHGYINLLSKKVTINYLVSWQFQLGFDRI